MARTVRYYAGAYDEAKAKWEIVYVTVRDGKPAQAHIGVYAKTEEEMLASLAILNAKRGA